MNDTHLSSLKMMVENLLASDSFYGLFCNGNHGIGKTTVVSNTLAENQVPFVTLSSYSTPLYFYNYLYKNKNKVILLDDTSLCRIRHKLVYTEPRIMPKAPLLEKRRPRDYYEFSFLHSA